MGSKWWGAGGSNSTKNNGEKKRTNTKIAKLEGELAKHNAIISKTEQEAGISVPLKSSSPNDKKDDNQSFIQSVMNLIAREKSGDKEE